MTPSNFQIDISKKNLGKNFPHGGSDPPNFFGSNYCCPTAMCLHNFIAISPELWPSDVCEHSKQVILASLRLYPRAQGVLAPKIFFAYFFLGQGHDSLKYSDRYLEKNLGKKFSPGGLTPNFFEKLKWGTKGSVPAKFHPDISKTVACIRWRNSGGHKKTNKLDGG